MTQVWSEDAKVTPVTVLKVVEDDVDFNTLKELTVVNVRGVSKGKGFQGVVKRHGFAGGPASHGHKHNLRTPGSIGATDPQRVFPGRKMPGQTGRQGITIKNLKVIEVIPEEKSILVKGAVPGMKGSNLYILTG